MANETIKVYDAELMKKFNQLYKLGSRTTAIKAAYNRASKPMKEAARNYAKASKNTGTLWKSIGMVSSRDYKTLFWLGPLRGKKRKFDAWYGYFVEKGTRQRVTKKTGANRGRIRAGLFYMKRSYEQYKGKVRINIMIELNKLIKKISDAKI